MSQQAGILICAEVIGRKIAPVTRELLAAGTGLADGLKQPLGALLLGREPAAAAPEVIRLGADKVYFVEAPPYAEAHPDLYVALLAGAAKQLKSAILLLSHDDLGRDTAPRLAARLDACVTTDCTRVTIDAATGRLLQEKPVYGGNAVAAWESPLESPHVITMRPTATPAAQPDASRRGEVIPLSVPVDASSIRGNLVETVREESNGVKLEDARVVVVGGGGIGSGEGFTLLEELAMVLGGTVGVSRVPCDEGWRPLSLEIGQTGHYVNPQLYIAVGVSGAPQHMAGCSSSKLIVAINRDPDANIFKEADLGVVGDYRQVLPALLERLKTARA